MSNSPTRKNLFNFLFLQETNLANLLEQRDQLGNSREDLQKVREIEQQITDTKSQMRSKIIEDPQFNEIDLVSMYFDNYRFYREPTSIMDFNRLNSKERLNNLERQINSDSYVRMPTLDNLNNARTEVENRNIEKAQNRASDISSQIDSIYSKFSNEDLRASRANFLQSLQKETEGTVDYNAIRGNIDRIDKEQEKRTNDIRDNLTRDRERPKDVELTFEEKQNLNLRSERQGRDIPYPDLTKPASGSDLGQLFPNKQAAGDAVIDVPKEDVIHNNQPSFSTESQSNPFIEQGEERQIPDYKIFSSVLGATCSLAFEAIKPTIVGTNPSTLLGIEFLQQFAPFGIKDSVESAINAIIDNKSSDVGNLRATSSSRVKLRMGHEKHSVFNNPILYPFVAISINFYLARTNRESLNINNLTYQALYYLLTYNLKVDPKNTDYLLQLFRDFPKELDEAFKANKDSITPLTKQQSESIKSYTTNAINSFQQVFGKKYSDEAKKYENGGTALISVLESLDNPQFLFEINQVFKTADNFLLSIDDNKDILIGLMGLIYAEAKGRNQLSQEAILNSALVDGIVYYNRGIELKLKERNVDLDILEQLTNKSGERNIDGYNIEYESDKIGFFTNENGDSILAFRGTDLKDKDDITLNFLNMAGSPSMFLDKEYSGRYDKAIELINKKLTEIENTDRGSISVVGNSLGGIGAAYMSVIYPSIPTRVYQPVVGKNELTDRLFKKLNDRNSLISFFAVRDDPISSNLKNYENDFEINYVDKSKFFDSHNLKNFN